MRISRRLLSTVGSPSSVNANEIAFFSRLSQTWWDESGELGLLHRMNPTRVGYIRQKVEEAMLDDAKTEGEGIRRVRSLGPKLLSGLDVLDVGCGGGLLSESLARLGGRTLGIDAASSSINVAKIHASQDPQLAELSPSVSSTSGSLQYLNTTTEDLLASDHHTSQFDVVCAMEIVEHVENPASFLKSCADLVKPGGHLFLSTISRTPLAHFLTITMAEDVLKLVSQGTHAYDKYVKPSELISLFRNDLGWIQPTHAPSSSLNVSHTQAEVRGMTYIPWSGTWILTPRGVPFELDCNYIFWARKPVSAPPQPNLRS
ncbi:Hexaprenyldihydroxybenzoate methyltransferase, mitochondrial [Tulasnella sp. JGI-2019a]|nr:Hexaprenyldihydroxybenzoate methyltransferase, mitochondrial [Tulasnella sp. JGI-2019a]